MARRRSDNIAEAARNLPPIQELQRRQRFVQFRREDAMLLAGLRETFLEHAPEVIDAFYNQLLRFRPLRAILGDAETAERLKAFQVEYLASLTTGHYGEAYLENRLRIGRVHERIGLQPQWYVGANSVYLDQLIPLVLERYRDHPRRATRACLALTKIMNLDVQIVLDAYFEARQQRAVEHSEQLAAVGELAASIAHEVRNPLAGMKGAMDVLRADMVADPSKLEIVEELLAQITRLENLVRDLLTFARPHPLERQLVGVHTLLDRVLRLVQEGGTANGVRFVRNLKASRDWLFADPQQLEQVFLNLVQNSLLAMEGGGVLTVSTRSTPGGVKVSVRDTGKGIAPGDLPRIFQPFFTTRHRGSGLGLAIVRKIVESHGGTIVVESRLGQGTKATVTLPEEAV